MKKYVIMGVQGCGKGTQAAMLVKAFDLVHISVGDILRWNVESHTKLAARVRRIMAAGKLVDDETIEGLIARRLEEHDWNYGFVLDGFPRNEHQTVFLLEHYDLDAVINIEVADEIVMERILGRRLCERCGKDTNVAVRPPRVEGTCDACGGRLRARADDNPEAIRTRLAEFHQKTRPVLDLLGAKERVVSVNGVAGPEEVHRAIRSLLGLDDGAAAPAC